MSNKISQNPWTMDVRVRDRNLKSGALTEKDLEKQLAALPDLEGQYDSFGTPQPALEQPRVVAPAVVASASVDDDSDDADDADESDSDLNDDDDDDSDDDDGNEPSDDVPPPAEGGGTGGES